LPLAKRNFKLKNLKFSFAWCKWCTKSSSHYCIVLRWAIVVGETFSKPCVFSSFPCNFLSNMLHVTSEGFRLRLLFGLPLVGYHSIFTISATNCRIII
jgi:hypothetical protein